MRRLEYIELKLSARPQAFRGDVRVAPSFQHCIFFFLLLSPFVNTLPGGLLALK
jgi:hypothetical protein